MTGKPALYTHVTNATPPWSRLLIIPPGTPATMLVKTPPEFVLRTIQGKKCRTASGLFDEFARALAFPDYFGHNWDALEECLADFDWLPAKGYIFLITDAHAVLPDDEAEYETLLEILSDAGEAWSKGQTADGRRAPFHVFFMVTEQEKSKRKRWELNEYFPTAQETPKAKPESTRSAKPRKK